jgi:hypothetical protein
MLKHLTMKKFQFILICFIWVGKSYCQTATNRIVVEVAKKSQNKIYTKVEIKSAFPGADSSLVQSLEKNLSRSIRDGKRIKRGKYIVSVVFILDKYGSLSDIECEKDPGFGLCEEVVAAIKRYSKWGPSEPIKVREYRHDK